MTYLHCLQHSLFEHLFNLYYNQVRTHTRFFCLHTMRKNVEVVIERLLRGVGGIALNFNQGMYY